jgi:membrane associated rhomboid family serine protease
MRVTYNSPVTLTFSLICAVLLALDQQGFSGLIHHYFVVLPRMDLGNPLDYFRLMSHIFGHANWGHFLGNFTFILLLGPILEEKYGSIQLMEMILVTAVTTGILNVLFFSTGLLGASGIVFMFIILSSFANYKSGQIPLTFVLVILIYLSKEIVNSLGEDHISQFAHIVGGLAGSAFGFLMKGK